MVFTSLNETETAAGKPTKQELFRKIRDNFVDHEARIADVEVAQASSMPIEFTVVGPYRNGGASQTSVLVERIPFNVHLTAARLLIHTAGSSGTTEVDVLYKRGAGAWTSIFATRPSVAYSAGSYALSTNAVFAVTDLLPNDLLRLDITSAQPGGKGFVLSLEYNVTA